MLGTSAFATTIMAGTQFLRGYKEYKNAAHMSTNERKNDHHIIDWLVNEKSFDYAKFTREYQIEEIEIASLLGDHTIPASYIYAPGNIDKRGDTVIMVHGLLGSRLSNYPAAQMFLNLGINVITYDQRSAGGNVAPNVTFGYLESYDLIDYVSYARNFMKDTSKLIVWGQSMGAATTGNAMDDSYFIKNVDSVILDCALGNMEDVHGVGPFPKLNLAIASFFAKREIGYEYRDQRVLPQRRNTKIPVLVAASKGDTSLPYKMQLGIFHCIKSKKKELYLVADSEHSDIYFDYPQEYQAVIEQFLNKW